jgi:hypothetical protein
VDLKYPLNAHIRPGRTSGAIRRQWNLQEAGPSGRKCSHWSCGLGGDLGTPVLFYPFASWPT